MPSFLLTLRDVLLLRRGPQDMPYSTQILTTVAALCIMVQLVVAVARDTPVAAVVIGAAMWLGFTLGVFYALLRVRGFGNRFVQAATTLLSCTLVFTVITLPIALFAGEPPAAPEQVTTAQVVLGLISLPLLIWKISVDAHVFRHSLEVPFLTGIVIALLWIVAAMALAGIAGGPAAAA